MEALGGVVSIIAVVDLSAKVLSLCSQYFKEVRDARSDIEELRKAVKKVRKQHERTRTLLEGRMGFLLKTSQELIKGHHGCKKELQSLRSGLKQNLNTRNEPSKIIRKLGWRALKWPFEAKTVRATIRKLREYQEDMTKGLVIDQTGLDLDNVEHSFLKSISSIPYRKHHNSTREKRTLGTCEWLISNEKFTEWSKSDAQVMLWLQGHVGVGKTCLVSKAVDHMQTISEASLHDEGFAFFYCDHQEESRRKPVSIFQCLLRQLLLSTKGYHKVREELYVHYQTQKSQEICLNLEECQEYLYRLVNESARTTIILDAMDECKPRSRRRIIESLETLLRKCHKPLRILVSSRPERDIRDKLSAIYNIEVRSHFNEADIQTFVEKEIVNHGNWNNMPSQVQREIEKTITDQSHGMFQWAALQVQQLLEQESIRNIRHRLGRLPNTLKGTYDELFAAIRHRNGTDRYLVNNALRWVMCAVKPLAKEELLSAIRLKIETDEFVLLEKITEVQLLKLCDHLLVFDTERNVWRFAHFSVAEYLEDIGLGIYKSHSDVAKACLKLLNQTVVDFDHDDITSKLTSDMTATDDIFRKDHPIQEYSRHHWIVHAQTQESTRENEQDDGVKKQPIDISLARQLKKFMGSFNESSPQYRCWLRQIDSDGSPPSTSAFYYLYEKTLNTWSRTFTRSRACKVSDTVSPASASILLASRFSLYKLLKDWWDADYDIFQTNHVGSNLLALAAAGASIPVCRELLRRGINVEEQRANCVEALVEAVDHDHVDLINLLIRTGKVDPNVGTRSNGSILVRAIARGNLEVVRTIVQEGQAEVNVTLEDDNYGEYKESLGEKIRFLEWLLILKKNPAFPIDVDMALVLDRCGSPLAAAASANIGNLEIVRFLVREGQADVDMPLRCGNYGTVLAAAAGEGRLQVVRTLVREGQTEVNRVLLFGKYGSALAAAAHKGRLDIIKLLIQEGQADVNMPLRCGNYGTSLVAAAAGGGEGRLQVVKTLVREGQAEVDRAVLFGKYGSALAAAASKGRLYIIKFLIREGHADVNRALEYGEYGSALAAAASNGHVKTVKFLVQDGRANVNMPLRCGKYGTALASAAGAGKPETVKFLVEECQAKINLPEDIRLQFGLQCDAIEAARKAVEDSTRRSKFYRRRDRNASQEDRLRFFDERRAHNKRHASREDCLKFFEEWQAHNTHDGGTENQT